MAKEAPQGQATSIVDQYGRQGIAESVLQSPTNDGGFIAQISGNPFFSAVSGEPAHIKLKQSLINLSGTRSRWFWCNPRRGPKRLASRRKPC